MAASGRPAAGSAACVVPRSSASTTWLPACSTPVAVLAPRLRDALEDLAEAGHAVARLVGEVRPAEERASLRREEQAHRPAALPGQRLDRGHVDLIEVRALLAVDLDRDEVRVQVVRGLLVLEALPLHHVAPVARRVADAQEDGTVEELRAGEGVGAPGPPVDGVVGVLEQVRAGLAGQAIGMHGGVGHTGADGTRESPSLPSAPPHAPAPPGRLCTSCMFVTLGRTVQPCIAHRPTIRSQASNARARPPMQFCMPTLEVDPSTGDRRGPAHDAPDPRRHRSQHQRISRSISGDRRHPPTSPPDLQSHAAAEVTGCARCMDPTGSASPPVTTCSSCIAHRPRGSRVGRSDGQPERRTPRRVCGGFIRQADLRKSRTTGARCHRIDRESHAPMTMG